MTGHIRVGTGGWSFAPWRGVFFPKGLRPAEELAFASRKLTAIEINATYRMLQTPARFAAWAGETPADFVFTIKAWAACTNRKVLADVGPYVQKFLGSGLSSLGERLGPILWQFMPNKAFDPPDFEAFLKLLPAGLDGLPLRHAVEVRHATFADPRFVDLCRERGVAICCADSADHPMIADLTADFVYARLMRGDDDIPTGYPEAELDAWARRLEVFAGGGVPDDLATAGSGGQPSAPRDVFAFFIREGKVRAPAASMALLERLS